MSVLRSQPARDSTVSVWLYQARGHQARQLFPVELQCAPFTWIAILIKFWKYFLSYNCIHAFINGFGKLFVLFTYFGHLTESSPSKLCHLHVPTPYQFMSCGS